MFSHVCAHTHTYTCTRGEAGLLGSSGLSEHLHLSPSTSGALEGSCAPSHRCECVRAGEQRAATQGAPAPPLSPLSRPSGAAPLCSSWKASLWICKYFNSQKLKEGVGVGAGVARWLSFCLSPAPVSGNSILETCSGVLVPYTRRIGHGPQWGRAGGRGPLAPPSLGPVTEQRGPGPLRGSAQPPGRGGTSARPL